MNNNKFPKEIPVVSYVNQCEYCGVEFRTDNENEKLCLVHKVLSDLKLPMDDTIVNVNLINLWQSKRYNKKEGIDRLLAYVAEGVIPLNDKIEDRKIYTVLSTIKTSVDNEHIEQVLNHLIEHNKDKKNQYDFIVVLRFSKNSDFNIYGLRYSKRLVKRLFGKDMLFRKKFALSLVTKYNLNKLENKK